VNKTAELRDRRVAVVIVNYRTPGLTQRCLAALRRERTQLPSLRAVVVDGGSGDNSAEQLSADIARADYADWVAFLPLPLNGGYGWANNQAILRLCAEEKPPEFIHILNPDAEVSEGSVASLVRELVAHSRCGAAGSQLLASDGQPAASAFRFPSPGQEFAGAAQSEKLRRLLGIPATVVQSKHSAEVDWVTGASVMFKTEALREVGLFDDGFFLYFEEVELMHRLRDAGWSIRHVPDSRVIHLEGAATGVGAKAQPLPDYWYRSRRRYYTLTGGRRTAIGAGLASLAGRTIATFKGLFGRSRGDVGFRARNLVRLGLWPRSGDSRRSVPRWGDPPGKPPAWMATE
jgi:N-acetylglucosaminyl-diphospho-decaprenol L-rhamnosyltransferase